MCLVCVFFFCVFFLFLLFFFLFFFFFFFFFFQAEDGIRDHCVTGVQTCALPICGERGAQVGRDEELLELRVERLTDRPLRLEHRAEAVREMLLRPPEPLAKPVPETPEERHWPSEGRTSRAIAAPLRPSGGRRWPFSSRVTPPALPMLRTNGRFETHSRTSPAGMFSSLIRPSSMRTRIHVSSDVRATSRYVAATSVTPAGAVAGGDAGVWTGAAGVGGRIAGRTVGATGSATLEGVASGAGAAIGGGGVRGSTRRSPAGWSASVTAKRATPRTTRSIKLTKTAPRPRASWGVPCSARVRDSPRAASLPWATRGPTPSGRPGGRLAS